MLSFLAKSCHRSRPTLVLFAPFQSPYITLAKMASITPDMKKYSTAVPENVNVIPQLEAQQKQLLTKECLEFLAKLHINFESTRQKLLAARVKRQEELNAGVQLNFLESTKEIREKSWTIAPLPEPMLKRRVEITGPVDRKMVINALNSGADCYMADFEDSNTPTWTNQLNGQINLIDAIRKKVDFTADNGKEYKLNEKVATLLVRPRGWHLDEKHIAINGQRISGSLFDIGVYFYHNAKELLNRGLGPFYYLPKLENHLEARLWNDVFVFAEKELSVPSGSIKATVLIETIVAAFEMDEILYELRDHSDRKLITMDSPFMRAYALLLVKTCHKRNAPAIGGMSALIPIKNDPAANEKALAGVREDKVRDATDGFDGGWVAHPGLVSLAMTEITKVLGDKSNQIDKQRPDVNVSAKDLLNFQPNSPITENGLRLNISVGIQYLAAWLTGTGCVPIMNLMEDAATAEISRSQIWQWINSTNGVLEDGRKVTIELVKALLQEELQRLKATNSKLPFDKAAQIFEEMSVSFKMEEFLTLALYESF